MKKLFAIACCVLLAGCAGGGLSESTGGAPLESDGQSYAPGMAGRAEAPAAEEQLTSTCTMRGQSAICH